MAQVADNILREKLLKINALYKEFAEDKEAKICVWLIEANEKSMMEVFYNMETSVLASSADLFVRLESPFQDSTSYNEDLYKELRGLTQGYRNADLADKIAFQWDPEPLENILILDDRFFLDSLADFGNSIEALEDRVIAYLYPSAVYDFKSFENWLIKQLEEGHWPDKVRIMVLDYLPRPQLTNMVAQFPGDVKLLEPKLEMAQAMKDISSTAGSPDDPGMMYRNHMIDLTEHASKKRMEEAETSCKGAVAVAVNNNWLHLQITALIALGAGWLNNQNPEKAIFSFDEAEKLAEAAKSMDSEEAQAAVSLLPNVLFSKGAALIQLQDYERAYDTYKKVSEAAQGNPFNVMEGFRMTGFCADKLRWLQEAFDAYEKAYQTFQQMDEESRNTSTLPYIGAALIRLNHELERGKRVPQYYEFIDPILGEGWEEHIEKPVS